MDVLNASRAIPEDIRRVQAARRWFSMREVADMLGFGLSKVKMLVITAELRSVKVGKYRRILPEWVDEYVAKCSREVL